MDTVSESPAKKDQGSLVRGFPWFTALTGSIERSTIPHGLDIQLPGVLRCRLGWLASQFLEEKSRASGIPNSPQKQGANHLSSTKLRLKIALIGKKKLGSKELPTQRKHYSPIFHGKSKEKLPYNFAFSNYQGCNLIPPGMQSSHFQGSGTSNFSVGFPRVDVKIDTLENQQGHNPFWAND